MLEDENDPLINEAIGFVVSQKRASISGVQRQFRIGYNRAAKLIESLEMLGVVSSPNSNGNREVLTSSLSDVSAIDFSVLEERSKKRYEAQMVEVERAREELNSLEYQMRLEAITNKRIVIWLDQKTPASEENPPVFVLRSHSPFNELSEKQSVDKDIIEEPLGDHITGYKFTATMQMRTPAKVLHQHGRIERVASWKLPKIVNESWQGIWSPVAKTWREIGIEIDEMPMGTMASDIGQVPADGGDYLRFLLFIKHLNSLDITYEEKKDWINTCYHMVGEDGEPFRKFMDNYGKNIEQIASRLLD